MEHYRILLIDVDLHSLREMSSFLKDQGYQVTKAPSGEDAIERLINIWMS